jgi:hypothetical protein
MTSRQKRVLIILCVLVIFIAVLLIFSPILKSTPIDIKVGETYQGTITLEDPPDAIDNTYRKHTYTFSVLVNEVYSINFNSLSGGSLLLFEYHDGNRTPLLSIGSGASGVKEYKVNSAGQKIFLIESPAVECPAEYSLRITKIRDS